MAENNKVPEQQTPQGAMSKIKAKFDKAQKIFLITSVLMTLIFAANSILNMIEGWSGNIQYVTIGLLAAYVVAFIVLLVLFKKDNKALKENMTNYKFAIKVVKQIVNIINLALAISVMIEALTVDTGAKKIYALVAAYIGIGLALLKFVFFIFRFIRKKKKAKAKAEKKAAKATAMAEKKRKINKLLGRDNQEIASEIVADSEDTSDSVDDIQK